jgi:hypothetical protein
MMCYGADKNVAIEITSEGKSRNEEVSANPTGRIAHPITLCQRMACFSKGKR